MATLAPHRLLVSVGKFKFEPTFRTLSCHKEKLRREKIKVGININTRSEKSI